MYAIIVHTRTQEDNTGDPEVDFDHTYDVELFKNQADAEKWQAIRPPIQGEATFQRHYMMSPSKHVFGAEDAGEIALEWLKLTHTLLIEKGLRSRAMDVDEAITYLDGAIGSI